MNTPLSRPDGRTLDALLDGSPDAAGRARHVAALLHAAWPGAGLCACQIAGPDGSALAALDAAGAERLEWRPVLEPNLADVSDEQTPAAPAGLHLTGQRLHLARAARPDAPGVLLVLGLPGSGKKTDHAADRQALAALAADLALRLGLEEQGRRLALARQELAEERGLANVGEASGVFLHELGNSLNVVLFELAILEHQAPAEWRGKLGELRKVAWGVAEQMQGLRRYEDSQRPRPTPQSLNRVARAVAAGWPAEGVALDLHLADDLPPVLASPGDLHRLLTLLTQLAVLASSPSGRVVLETRREADRVVLRVRVPTLATEAEPNGAGHHAWAICQRLLRRLRGTAKRATLPDGSVVFQADLTPVPG